MLPNEQCIFERSGAFLCPWHCGSLVLILLKKASDCVVSGI